MSHIEINALKWQYNLLWYVKIKFFPLSYVMIFIAFLVQVCRQQRGGRGGFLKYWFLLTWGGVGVQKGQKYTDVILEQPLINTLACLLGLNTGQLWGSCSEVSDYIETFTKHLMGHLQDIHREFTGYFWGFYRAFKEKFWSIFSNFS